MVTSTLGAFAIGGSRSLSLAGQALATAATAALLGAGYRLVVGCCVGADAAVIRSALGTGHARQLHILSAFGPITPSRAGFGAAGTCNLSAVSAVQAARLAGAQVTPWAGGGADLAITQRLALRTSRVGSLATAGGLVILDNRLGPGGQRLASAVALRHLQCWALTVDNTAPPGPGWVRGHFGPFPAWCLSGIRPSRLDLAAPAPALGVAA